MVVDMSIAAMRTKSGFITRRKSLVGAGVLDVTRLLAAVADTLGSGLGRAVSRKVTDLAACGLLVGQATHI
jgi:hypothetical protein